MNKVLPGRYTADIEGDFVVFLIGMRINQYWALHKWGPVAMAMGPMLQSLEKDPASGFLGAENFFNLRVSCSLQYWRSFEDLEHFSRDSGKSHRAAWQRFNKAVGNNGSVGIWHETYKVKASSYECVYGNMPLFGLAKASKRVAADGKWAKARSRISRGEAKVEKVA